jgi:shikimate dehydrogenase
MNIFGDSSLYGIIGCPVKHTASPAMHNEAFDSFGIHAVYVPMELHPGELKAFFSASRFLLKGFNVTVPFKRDALRYVDKADEHSKQMDSVNTIVNEDGVLKGYNTDFLGLQRSVRKNFGFSLKNRKICIIGAGGAASSALYLAVMEGAESISIVNRTFENARALSVRFKKQGAVIRAAALISPEAKDHVSSSEVVINSTSLGLKRSDPLPVPKNWLKKGQCVMDMIYNPPETNFLKAAAKAGCRTANGLDMLVYQGMQSFKIWTGKTVSYGRMRKAAQKAIFTGEKK